MALGQESYSSKLDNAFSQKPEQTAKEKKLETSKLQDRADALEVIWIEPDHMKIYAALFKKYNVSVRNVLDNKDWLLAKDKQVAKLEWNKKKEKIEEAVHKIAA